MSSLLALETASDACSVACVTDGTLVMETALYRRRSHSARLVPMIADLLRTSEVTTIDAVAVSAGPGSYTGLRIGVSTAKGLAMAYDADLVGVPTLEVLAGNILPVGTVNDVVVALLHARRKEWYSAAYRIGEDGIALEPVRAPSILTEEDLGAWMSSLESPSELWLTTAGGKAPRTLSGDKSLRTLRTLASSLPRARWVGHQGWLRWQQRLTDPHDRFEPIYLRPYRAKKASSPLLAP